MLTILLAMPYGVFFHRDRLDGFIAYTLVLVGVLAVISVLAPTTTVRAFSKFNLVGYGISLIQQTFGASIGFVVSALIKKLWK